MTLTSGSAVTRGMAAPGVALALAATCATTPVSLSAWHVPVPAVHAAPVIAAHTDGWDTLTADITLRRGRRDARGRRVGAAAKPIRYRLERTRVGGAWRTTLRMPRSARPLLTLEGSVRAEAKQAVALVESDADGGPPRLLDATGAVVAWPDASSLSWLPSAAAAPSVMDQLRTASRRGGVPSPRAEGEGMGSLVAARSANADRRAALERVYGPARGRSGALDRFLVETEGRLRETLVDPVSALPVEINDTDNGTLVAHRTFAYVDGPGGAVLRRAAHTEWVAPDGSGDRISVDVELSNVRFERRR